jgi:hypothetical protein
MDLVTAPSIGGDELQGRERLRFIIYYQRQSAMKGTECKLNFRWTNIAVDNGKQTG